MYSGDDTLAGGLPHSEIHGSKLAHSSPWLIAACHVLHRLCAPRHPPDALKTLDYSHYHCSFPIFQGRPAMLLITKRPTIIRFTRPRTSVISSSVGRSSLQDSHVHERHLQPAKPISPRCQPFNGSTAWSDRPATPASGKSLLHDVNEPDKDRNPCRIFDWTNSPPPAPHSCCIPKCALVEPDGIEPTTSSLQS